MALHQVTMPRFQSRRMAPIQSVKHVIDTEGALTGGTTSDVPLSVTVESRASPFNPVELDIGEQVNGFFLSIFLIGAGGAGVAGSINWYIGKARAGQAISSFPAPANTGVSDLRNQIFHEEKGLVGSADGTPMAFKGVVVVPKGMRRTRSGDQFFIKLRATDNVNDVNFCVKAIYKSFS